MSNGLDPDQDRYSVRPEPGSNCLQRLSADRVQLADQIDRGISYELGCLVHRHMKYPYRCGSYIGSMRPFSKEQRENYK